MCSGRTAEETKILLNGGRGLLVLPGKRQIARQFVVCLSGACRRAWRCGCGGALLSVAPQTKVLANWALQQPTKTAAPVMSATPGLLRTSLCTPLCTPVDNSSWNQAPADPVWSKSQLYPPRPRFHPQPDRLQPAVNQEVFSLLALSTAPSTSAL